LTPSRRRPVVSYMHDTYRVIERRACRVARIAVSTFRYESRQEPRLWKNAATSWISGSEKFCRIISVALFSYWQPESSLLEQPTGKLQ